jgi:uncharacterized protein (TIGR00159 family)
MTIWSLSTLLYVCIALLDIGSVYYLIYRILLLIRGTQAQQMLVGMALIAGSFLGSKLLGLRTLSWILDNFISSFVLIVIVIFQHDIRRGLSRVGKRPMFEAMGYASNALIVEELTRSTESLAKDRIGALILIEREADLTEWAESGLSVDARVSAGLLVQIFTPPGPLHDGSVVVQNGRLTAAAVFLPLTQNPRLDPTLGTRHRAAVGATEELDAIAIVVSEESGQISIAEGGSLTRDLNSSMLRKLLQRQLGDVPASKKIKMPFSSYMGTKT